MSEPRSLFVKASFMPMQFEQFMEAEPSQPVLDAMWQAWWQSREMSGKMALTQDALQATRARCYRDYVQAWLDEPSAAAFSSYHFDTFTWTFGITQFSENYLELLPMLAMLVDLGNYRCATAILPDDFALVYPFFWGDSDVMAYLCYGEGETIIDPTVNDLSQIPEAQAALASKRLDEHWQTIEATFNSQPD
ncbi:hypothetical protein [Leeia sp.]|uniref:hypothetical protein n=1 Tax=Leeia sp. TaxID=2884678 RepID=UPI0035B1845B